MGTKRKKTITVKRSRNGFVRTTERTPFSIDAGERFDLITITYRPHGFKYDMVRIHAEGPREGKREKPLVNIYWHAGGRDYGQEPDNFLAARAFARALRDAMVQAERLRRHMEVD